MRPSRLIAALAPISLLLSGCAAISVLASGSTANPPLHWAWSYGGDGIAAAGTLTTSNVPDSQGHYTIIGIAGTRNGQVITGLQPPGTPIPGNAPYAVDNLLSGGTPQLTEHGFGFSLANGDNANPFAKDSGYLEYVSAPPHPDGKGTERPVTFTAKIVP